MQVMETPVLRPTEIQALVRINERLAKATWNRDGYEHSPEHRDVSGIYQSLTSIMQSMAGCAFTPTHYVTCADDLRRVAERLEQVGKRMMAA